MPQRPYVVLALQGGGARAAYQVGVYEALLERGLPVDWVCGVSSGALNAAVIAGNAEEDRVARLKAMWRSFRTSWDPGASLPEPWATFGRVALTVTAGFGRRGFYRLRWVPGLFATPGSDRATSLYSLAPLRRTLERCVDFDRIAATGGLRLSVGAVDVQEGVLRFFDSARERIEVEQIVASGSMPPGAPPVRIHDRLYWDGGLVGDTPLQNVLQSILAGDTDGRGVVVIVVDLFRETRGAPRSLLDAVSRREELVCSSRMEVAVSRFFSRAYAGALGDEADPLSAPDLTGSPRLEAGPIGRVGVIRLRSRDELDLGWFEAYDFTRSSIERRMKAGREHTLTALSNTVIDFDLFGADPESDMFLHFVRDGELMASKRRPLPGSAGDAAIDEEVEDPEVKDPTDLVEAISLTLPALLPEELAEDDSDSDEELTRSWTNIRAIRLEQTVEEVDSEETSS